MHLRNVPIDGGPFAVMITAFGALVNATVMQTQMLYDSGCRCAGTQIDRTMRTTIGGLVGMQCRQMVLQHCFVDGLVMATARIADETAERKEKEFRWLVWSNSYRFKITNTFSICA